MVKPEGEAGGVRSDERSIDEAPRGDAAFLAGFAVANVGAFVSFLPLLQIILPLKAAEIAPQGSAALLGQAAALGAVVAGGANVAAGWLSDRTRSRFGRRKPWILGGLVGVAASYGLLWRAQSPLALLLGVAAFQVAFNAMFAALLALVPDRIAAARRGVASALFALGYPLGTAIGAVVIGTLVLGEGARFLALAALLALSVAPFAIRLSPHASRGPAQGALSPQSPPRAEGAAAAFALGWLGRTCVLTAFSINQIYLLFYLQAVLRAEPGWAHAAEHGVAVLGVLFGTVSALAGVLAGWASDKTGLRRPFVIGGALTVGVGAVGLSLATHWPAVLVAYGVFSLGAGCHTATDFAMMVDLLPRRDRAGRDLGLLNLSNIAPQVIAPLAGVFIIEAAGGGVRGTFAAAGAAAAAGAGLVGLMRRVR